jgi:cellulose synthase/poly-beta-1,6-N-acetylglucosamine synthase-like glycosyltransferase
MADGRNPPKRHGTAADDFRIVVPVFNEGAALQEILTRIDHAGYLHRISFVDDGSTDSSGEILARWREDRRIDVTHLPHNMKKEGAIRHVLEGLFREGRLPEHVLLLDADSFIETAGEPIELLYRRASAFMRTNSLAGLALRIEALIDADSNALQKCVYVDYAGVQFDNWITSTQRQLWVINGPGGLFAGRELLLALRAMTPDFETGDLQITVNLMKRGLKVGFFPPITVKTRVPSTIASYFRQRRRWERGTVKVLWHERRFYLSSFWKCRLLALQTTIHLSIYAGIAYLAFLSLFVPDGLSIAVVNLAFVTAVWWAINVVKMYSNQRIRRTQSPWKLAVWAMWNGVIWLFVTSPARVAGFVDAVFYLTWHSGRAPSDEFGEGHSLETQGNGHG